MKSTGKTQKNSHALVALAFCFLASAAMRVETVSAAADDLLKKDDKAHESAAGDDGMHQCDQDVAALLKSLKQRETEFSKREIALHAHEAKLEAVEERLTLRIAELEKMRDDLAATVAVVDGAQQRDIDHLVTMYSTMKPKRAGALLNQMDINFASELLARMKPETAALILANMENQNAFAVSLSIARRNENAPTE